MKWEFETAKFKELGPALYLVPWPTVPKDDEDALDACSSVLSRGTQLNEIAEAI